MQDDFVFVILVEREHNPAWVGVCRMCLVHIQYLVEEESRIQS